MGSTCLTHSSLVLVRVRFLDLNMKLSIAVSVLLIGSCMAMPQSDDEKGLRDTIKDLGKTVITNAVASNLECHSDNCLPPFYYCHTTGTLSAVCRYTGLTWFLMIGLPLIIIGAGVGIWYYRKKRAESA